MKRLPAGDKFVWDIFVEACGSRCAVCGDPNVKLERGHVIPHKLDSLESYDNLLPVCRSCNAKHKKQETPTKYRPADYLEVFYIKLGQALRPQISCIQRDSKWVHVPSSWPLENKHVIAWEPAENGQSNPLYQRSYDTMTRREAEIEVNRLITAARHKVPPSPLPIPDTRTGLINLAMQHGRQFHIAGTGFLADMPWVVPGRDGEVNNYAWVQFTANFEIFLAEGIKVQQAASERKRRDAEQREKDAATDRQRRWDKFQLAAKCTDWPDMTGEDRVFIAAVRLETELRDVSDGELERAKGIRLRELVAKRQVVANRIALYEQMIALKNLEQAYDMKDFHDGLAAAGTVKDVVLLQERLTQFYDESLVYELGPMQSDELTAW
jgi:hypothetical protein